MGTLALVGCTERPAEQSTSTDIAASATPSPTPTPAAIVDPAELATLEAEFGARLGLFAVDTATGATVEHRADERFGYASTIKAFAAAAVLAQTTDAELDAVVPIAAGDVVDYSPVTGALVGTGISLRDAAGAAITVSDNTALNVLLKQLGGPQGLEDALRAAGDTTTDPERDEPTLNAVVPGSSDTADTSTPRAMAETLRAFAVGEALEPADRDLLTRWLRDNTTGGALVRAGVPDGWVVGDKTGAGGDYGSRNDIAVIWPAGGNAPWVLAILTDKPDRDAEPSDELLARATQAVVQLLEAP